MLEKLLVILALLGASTTMFAQAIGVEAGVSNNVQNGYYLAPCQCTFAKGTGIGFGGSVFYELPAVSDVVFGIRSGVQYQQVTDYEVVPSTLNRIANGDEQQTMLTYLSLGPSVRYTIPSTAIFLRVSPEVHYLLSSDFHHMEPSMSGHRAGTTQIPAHGSSEENPVIDDIRRVRMSAKFSAGYDLLLGSSILSPLLTYDVPLNTIRSNSTDKDWKISSFFGSVMVRFPL
jgi:hypothetical protein